MSTIAATSDKLPETFEQIATADAGWTILYRDRDTAQFWELSYPSSHMHGGGPRRLRQLLIESAHQWKPDENCPPNACATRASWQNELPNSRLAARCPLWHKRNPEEAEREAER
jgi:hypothetical protein